MKVEQSGSRIDLDEFLKRPTIANLSTVSPNGPCASPVWFLWEDDAIWLIGSSHDSFPKRIEADRRCALGFVDFNLNAGFLQHVGMRGIAVVVVLDPERLYRLLRRYLGPDRDQWNQRFREDVIDRLDLMIRFDPDTVVVRDQSYFK